MGEGRISRRHFGLPYSARFQTHGNDGYTGTLAEKYEYVLFDTEGMASARDVARWALDLYRYEDDGRELPAGMPVALLPLIRSIASVTDDKWGPSGALQLTAKDTGDPFELPPDEEAYLFFGRSSY